MTRRLAAWWFAAMPAERLAVLRIAIGGFAFVWVASMLPELIGLASLPAVHFAPVGVVRVLDGPLPGGAVNAIAIATLALLGGLVVGWRYRVVAPLAAAGLVWTLSYRSSWGMVFHTENLLVLHVIALACAPRPSPGTTIEGWPVRLLGTLTVATYVLAGIAKLRLAGADWVTGDQLAVQIAIDNVRKAVIGGHVAPLASLVLAHPWLLAALATGTLAVELGAPIALAGGRLAVLWIGGAWAFHVGVVLAMNIWFPYPLSGVAFLPLLPVERVWGMWRRRRR